MSSMPAKGKHHHMPHHQQQQQHHSHHQQQQQQQQHHQQQPPQHLISQSTGTPQAYNAVVASRGYVSHAGSDFHVSGQNYGAQSGAQVGGGGGNIGVPGGRGPSLAGIPPIGQSTTGGPAGGQQQPPQVPTPGVQQQQPQGPTPTTTPPVHTPSPQEMGKQAHLQPQPPSLQQNYVPNQSRQVSAGYYSLGTRQPQQSRGLGHRGNQSGNATHVVGMQGVAGNAGQPAALYSHHQNITVPVPAPMYMPNPHQQVYQMNNQMQQLVNFGPRHQLGHGHQYYSHFQPHPLLPNMYSYPQGHPQAGYVHYQQHAPPNAAINLNRGSSNVMSGGGQNVGGPLAGAQGTTAVPQGTLQQPTQQPQTISPMAISLTPTAYTGHNGGTMNTMNTYQKSTMRQYALTDIVDPVRGVNVANEIYQNSGGTPSEDVKNRQTPQSEKSATEIAAEFASQVAKAASESSDTSSNTPSTSVQENSKDGISSTTTTASSISQTPSQSITSLKSQSNVSKDPVISQCNTVPVSSGPINIVQFSNASSESQLTAQIESCPLKIESKPISAMTKEFWPNNDAKKQSVSIEEPSEPVIINKDNIPTQKFAPVVPAFVEDEPVNVSYPSSALLIDSATTTTTTTTTPSISPSARESFLPSKSSSSSPPRRKPNQQSQVPIPAASTTFASATIASVAAAPVLPVQEAPKEQRERTISERSVGGSRGGTPTPTQTEQYQKNGESVAEKLDVDQKSADGKAMQKQKSKNKLKGRDLNRKGAEKEGTDMDAFVAVPQPAQTEVETQPEGIIDTLPVEISVKEKETTESKPDAEIEQVCPRPEKKLVNSEMITKNVTNIQNLPSVEVPVENHKETSRESTPTIEDSNKSEDITEKRENDVVDHVNVQDVKDVTDVEALVAQKNEENVKDSSQRASSEENSSAQVIDKQNENEPPNQIDSTPKPSIPKYKYNDYQWSPTNPTGKKEYDREFLMKLQDDPKSRIRPPNLPDLEVVLKSCTKQSSRNVPDYKMFKDRAHDQFVPFVKTGSNVKMPFPQNKKSYPDNKKPKRPNVIHVTLSLREDIKLREAENAWKPTRVKCDNPEDNEVKKQALYKKVRSVLNKLTPQMFDTLVNQVRNLKIESQEHLEGVIDLVFQKAVDEPNFSVAYALMCKELAQMHVASGDKKVGTEKKQDNKLDFRRLILNRCQYEFEKNAVAEVARGAKAKELEECTDPEKKKELALVLEDEDRRFRMQSVGNIRFIGELFKLDMIRIDTMHTCINELLRLPHEENLECLCKLLTTIGKTLEGKGKQDLGKYFEIMKGFTRMKTGPKKISSRVRFMLQDVIDLRARNWVPRRDEGNPKTMDQVVKDAESERLDIELMNSAPLNTPRKDDRNNDRRRNRAAGSEDGWSLHVGKGSRQVYAVETSKLSAKPPSMDEIKLGGRSMFLWGASAIGKTNPMTNKFAALENIPSTMDQDKRSSQIQLPGSRSTGATRDYRPEYKQNWENRGSRNGNHQLNSSSSSLSNRDSSREMHSMDNSRSQSMSMPTPAMKYKPPSAPVSNKTTVTKEQQHTIIVNLLKGIDTCEDSEAFIKTAIDLFDNNFDDSYAYFVEETLNMALEKNTKTRNYVACLFAHMIKNNLFPLSLFQVQCDKLLDIAKDLAIDVPKLWIYIGEVIAKLVTSGVHPFGELKRTTMKLKSIGSVGDLLGETIDLMAKDQGPKWVADEWIQSGLNWNDLIDSSQENAEEIIKEHNLQFLTNGGIRSERSSDDSDMTMDQIHDHLLKLMGNSKRDNITSWITASVGDRSNQPQFIRVLTTAMLEVSIEQVKETHKLNGDLFKSLLPLITKYVDTDPQLELQCLFAIQAYNHKLMHPQGILGQVIDALCEDGIISDDAFLAWQKCKDPAEMPGHAVAVKALTSFFVSLQEPRDESSEEA